MSIQDQFGQLDPNRVLDNQYFSHFGLSLSTESSMREKIIAVTIDDIGRIGPTSFNAKFTCEALGIAPSLINHHFGSRDELIAEATLVCYRRYVEMLWEAVLAGPQTPKGRLRSWIETSVDWTGRMAGWGPILNYPTSSLEITKIIDEKYRDEMTNSSELNLARLLALVGDVKRGRVSNTDFAIGEIPRLRLMKDPRIIALTSSIGWSTLGLATWKAGRHLPSGGIKEVGLLERQMVKAHIDRLIDQITKD
jgi:AcrR family transcriptional regulator